MKNAKNWKNSEKVKIEMMPFGTLYEPPGSQKKCSEQLGLSSIDGSCQMVRTGAIKLKKGQYVFGFRDRFVNVLLLTLDFLSFSFREGSESCNIVIQNWFLFKFRLKTFFSWFFILSFCCTYNSSNLFKNEICSKVKKK